LKADLELCNRASGESWKQASDTGYPYTIMDETFENVMAVYCTGDDAQFIAQAREGWPHAIERAIETEELSRELLEALKFFFDRMSDRDLVEPEPSQFMSLELSQIATLCHKAEEVLRSEDLGNGGKG